MVVYAGIDEAGYGPKLGPYVVGISAFALPGALEVGTVRALDLFEKLKSAIANSNSKPSERLVVADSKKLFSSTSGIERLEEAFLSFYLSARPGRCLPAPLAKIVSDVAIVIDDVWDDYPWYAHMRGEEEDRLALPIEADPSTVDGFAGLLQTVLSETDVRLVDFRASVMPVRSFNRALGQFGNKGKAGFHPIGLALARLWEEHGHEGVFVRIDKQGGRARYEESLRRYLTDVSVNVLTEVREESRYIVTNGQRKMLVYFAMRSDENHLPVCLASIAAKYFRETLMEVQNRWFHGRSTDLRPTKGYPGDAPRWLEESATLRGQLGIGDQFLIRNL